MKRRSALLLSTLIGGASCAAAADSTGQLPPYEPHACTIPANATYLTGDGAIRIVGNDGMEEMLTKLNTLFTASHPNIRFAMVLKGSSTGIGGLAAGVSAFAPMGRDAWPFEVRPFRQTFGYEPLDIHIGRDGYAGEGRKNPPAVYVHAGNPVHGLTLADVTRIFTRGNPDGDVSQWNQVGATGAWASHAIHPYGLADNGGAATAARHSLLTGHPFARSYEPCASTAEILQSVAGDKYGIGLAGFCDPAKVPSSVVMLPIATTAGAPYSTGTREEVQAGSYPLTPFAHIYVNRRPGQALDPFVREYLRLVLSREGQAAVAASAGSEEAYVPLTAEEVAIELAKLGN